MNKYEYLLQEAYEQDIIVKEKPLQGHDGRIKGDKIAIRKSIETSAQKACVLAEELGHYYTSTGNILDLNDYKSTNLKQERKARAWAYDKLIGLDKLTRVHTLHNCNIYDFADFLNVDVGFLIEAIEYYKDRYEHNVEYDDYVIQFIPYLKVFKKK